MGFVGRRKQHREHGVLPRALSALRHFPDRLLHRRRHIAVRDRISTMGRPRTLLILCHGNLCRSPYLQAVIKRALPEMRVESAGFMALGGPAPAFAVTVSARRGIDLSGFRSRPLVQAMVRGADLIVV